MVYIYVYMYYICIIYAYIISVSQAYFGRISIYRSPVFCRKSLPSQVADPTEQPRRPQRLQRFKRTVPQRTSWVLVDLPHFAKRGRSVYCEQFAQQQQISTNHSFWHEDVCIICVSGVSMHQTHLARCCFCQASTKIENYPRKHTFGLGWKMSLTFAFQA